MKIQKSVAKIFNLRKVRESGLLERPAPGWRSDDPQVANLRYSRVLADGHQICATNAASWRTDAKPAIRQRPARVVSGVTFLAFVALLTLACSCSGPGRLRGGKAMTVPKPSGGLSQSLVQGDDASQSSKQNQDTIRVRTYT